MPYRCLERGFLTKFQISLFESAYFLDKIWTKIAKRGDLNALQTSSELKIFIR
jgi:hypothetical protein